MGDNQRVVIFTTTVRRGGGSVGVGGGRRRGRGRQSVGHVNIDEDSGAKCMSKIFFFAG